MAKEVFIGTGLWATFILLSKNVLDTCQVPKQRRKPSKVGPEMDQKIKEVMATLTCAESGKYNKARAMVDPEFRARRLETRNNYYKLRYNNDEEYKKQQQQRVFEAYQKTKAANM
jgi:hypothetical protein